MIARAHELDLIALAARGVFTADRLDAIGVETFETDASLFAWTCASRACRLLGAMLRAHAAATGRACFFAVHYMRVTASRLDLPLDVWAALMRDTEAVIDAAEQLDQERSRQAAERGRA